MSNKAIVINQWWAGVISLVASGAIMGGAGYAWDAHSQQEVMKEKVSRMEVANLPDRMARLEENVTDIKTMQRDTGRKIDILIDSQRKR